MGSDTAILSKDTSRETQEEDYDQGPTADIEATGTALDASA